MPPPLSRVRVVLVRPQFAGNLGSVARVMKNFGLTDLVLVAPVADPASTGATMMAVHAADVLANARIVPTFVDAVADCGLVIATSGEVGGLVRRGFWGTPEEQTPAVLDAIENSLTAIIFGPEPSGLTAAEVAACHGMMFIPADPGYPSLNLAQAVAVVAYELRRQWLKRGPADVPLPGSADAPATFHEQEILFERLRKSLAAVRFLWDHRADGLFHVIRHVIARARPTLKELKVLHGLAGQLLHVARVYGVVHPSAGRPPVPPAELLRDPDRETAGRPGE